MIPLGLFTLKKPIGRGGMAVVWEAEHREEGYPVAVKVLTTEKTRDPLFLTSFRNEVRAVAGLQHPNIIQVFDYGEVSEETEKASKGQIQAGSPYLVMELANGGSLRKLCGKIPWTTLRRILLALLDALAHAHARGVIHRDLKPRNVLFCPGRNTWLVTDFGLAHALDQEALAPWEEKTVMGTPTYMAPEQFECLWRDYGPWTDLYAFGCLVYTLCTGAPPFSSAQPVPKLMFAHMRLPFPELKTQAFLPDDFRDWLNRLVKKEPHERFRRAADAAWALLNLDDPSQTRLQLVETAPSKNPDDPDHGNYLSSPKNFDLQTPQPFPGVFPQDDTAMVPGELPDLQDLSIAESVNSQTLHGLNELLSTTNEESQTIPGFQIESVKLIEPSHTPSSSDLLPAMQGQIPPLPPSWKRNDQEQTQQLFGAGLSLFGLREIPFVGRENERNQLWQSLHRTRDDGQTHIVVLRGPAGCGKSRLARWLCERAHEAGAAKIAKGVHSTDGGTSDGIAPMLMRYMRCVGLKREETLERIQQVLTEQGVHEPYEWEALTEFLQPATPLELEQGAKPIRFGSLEERFVLLQRYFRRLSRKRLMLLWLDDVQWGLESIQFVQRLAQNHHDEYYPTLFILTAQEEALTERDAEAALLDELLTLPNVSQINVGPLPPEHRSAMIRELLGLESELAARVEERTKGNPLFTVQLMEDWIQRGILELGEFGYRLKEGAHVELPDNLHDVWNVRIERILAGRPEHEGHALELAAILGQEVNTEEWHEACEEAELTPPTELVEELLAQRLAQSVEGGLSVGWSFVHAMLQESLERRAKEAGRRELYHKLCADLLSDQQGAAVSERLGRHLLAAGLAEEALSPLLDGTRQRIEIGDFQLAKALLSQWKENIESLDLPTDDERWGRGWLLWSRFALSQGSLEQADAWAGRVEKDARKYGWRAVRAQALRERGRISRERGDVARAWRRLQEAEVLAQSVKDKNLLAHCRQDMGHVLSDRGSLERAAKCFQRSRNDFDSINDPVNAGMSCLGLGSVSMREGEYEEAIEQVKLARAYFNESGSRSGVAHCMNVLGEISRLSGDIEGAENYYRRALQQYSVIGTDLQAVPKANLGLVLLERGDYLNASQTLKESLVFFEAQGRLAVLGAIHAFLLPCVAFEKDWARFDHHYSRAQKLLKQTAVLDLDVPRMTSKAGDLAREFGKYTRARQAYHLALHQWQELDRHEEVERVRAILQTMSTFANHRSNRPNN